MIIIIAKIGWCSSYYDHSRCVNTMPDMLRMWPNGWLGELMLLFCRRYVNSKQMLSVACFYRAKYKLNCYQFGRMCLMPCAASSKNEDKNGNWLTQFALQRSLGIFFFGHLEKYWKRHELASGGVLYFLQSALQQTKVKNNILQDVSSTVGLL